MQNGNEKRIEALRVKRDQVDAEIMRLQARSKIEARKADTRRKILTGAVVLQEMSERPKFDAWIRNLLAEKLTKDRDRALFGLARLPANSDKKPGSGID